ncbi:hypothetical protein ACQKGO_19285 [Corallococcus interemptor]|uniref:hypothetical protein n=1 Tax=Corallococcus interemptor TaxID=2316720 RepID=UPI003CFD60F1
MGARLSQVLLVAVATVAGLFLPLMQAEDWARLLEAVLSSAAVWRLSMVEQGVVHRLAELGVYAVAGAMLGNVQAFTLRRAGLQVAGWAGMTALAVAVGLVGSRALAVALGLSPGMGAVGMGVVVGLTQGWLLRREVHGAAVWVAACAVGYGMAGPAADWKARAWQEAVETGMTWRLSSITLTAQAMTWGALALCMAIGGAFILSSLRTQVLPAPGSRMPGALGQFAVLGLALPLMVALEAREKSPPPREFPPPNAPARPQPRPTRTWGPAGESNIPGCASRGCAPAQTSGVEQPPSSGTVVVPEPRQAPTVHDEHLRVLTGTGRARVPSGARWNNRASTEGQPIEPAASGSRRDNPYENDLP